MMEGGEFRQRASEAIVQTKIAALQSLDIVTSALILTNFTKNVLRTVNSKCCTCTVAQ
jgi:hypothetical protein